MIVRKPLKQVANVIISNVDKRSNEVEESVSLCNYVDVYYNKEIIDGMPFMPSTATKAQIKDFELKAGDVLFTKDSETSDDIAVSAYVPNDLPGIVCGYHLAIARPRKDVMSGRFLNWAIQSQEVRDQFTVLATGVTRVGLRQDEIRSVEIPVPSCSDQVVIADFLDVETARIDELISKKLRLINLLREREVRDLDDAILLGSSVDSIKRFDGEMENELPQGWKQFPVKRISQCENSGAWGEDVGVLPISIPVATTAQISSEGEFQVDRMPLRSFNSIDAKRYRCNQGDIVVVKSSGSATNIISGKAGLVDNEVFVFSNFLMRLIPNRNLVLPRFLYFALTSHLTRQRIERMVSATTYPNLQVGEYLAAQLPIPSIEKQQLLIDEIDANASKSKQVRLNTLKSVELLREFRRALISAAVTGELDLPGVSA